MHTLQLHNVGSDMVCLCGGREVGQEQGSNMDLLNPTTRNMLQPGSRSSPQHP